MRNGWVVLVMAVATACAAPVPALDAAPDVPADVTELADDTWQRTLAAFPARTGCIEHVRLEVAWELADRGRYDPDGGTVVLRIPHTPPRLRQTLVHELAHHVEFTCPDHAELRTELLDLLDASDGWFGGDRWADVPSEQWAEHVTEVVLGPGAARPGIAIDPAALAAIRVWGGLDPAAR